MAARSEKQRRGGKCLHQKEKELRRCYLRIAIFCGEDQRRHVPTADLSPAALALGGTLDDPRQVEQLDVGAVVLDDARDAGERGELVAGALRLRLRQRAQQRRLRKQTTGLECFTTQLNVYVSHSK